MDDRLKEEGWTDEEQEKSEGPFTIQSAPMDV